MPIRIGSNTKHIRLRSKDLKCKDLIRLTLIKCRLTVAATYHLKTYRLYETCDSGVERAISSNENIYKIWSKLCKDQTLYNVQFVIKKVNSINTNAFPQTSNQESKKHERVKLKGLRNIVDKLFKSNLSVITKTSYTRMKASF